MAKKLLLGPLLGLESEDTYTISVLTDKSANSVSVEVAGKTLSAKLLTTTLTGKFWSVKYTVTNFKTSTSVSYAVLVDGIQCTNQQGISAWQFYIPNKDEQPKIAYTSCNGFSSADLMMSTEHPNALWEQMAQLHQSHPFSLLIMGGDQLYADEVWTKVKSLEGWIGLKMKDQLAKKATASLMSELERFYEQLYIARWNQEEVAAMLASIPNIMMWDDHDIFDGWGSYPKALQECDVFQAIFKTAAKYFSIFQLRCKDAALMLSQSRKHFAYALHFRSYSILAMDHRSQRSIYQVMGSDQWTETIAWLTSGNVRKNLLVMSGVPVVYRDFGSIETAVDLTWWTEETTDDLKDHWRAKEHQGERMRLIHQLLNELQQRKDRNHGEGRTVLLSGDVHVGCLGVIMDKRTSVPQKIHQLVSSAIVHPAPTFTEWAGIKVVTNDRNEYLNEDHSIETAILRPIGSDTYIRARNFATLEEGSDKKLWINWINESKDKPVYPLE